MVVDFIVDIMNYFIIVDIDKVVDMIIDKVSDNFFDKCLEK